VAPVPEILVVVVAVIVALVRGGRYGGMPQFRWWWVLWGAVACEGVALGVHALQPLAVSAAYDAIVLFVGANLKWFEFRVVLVGVAMNAVEVWANRGAMPVYVNLPLFSRTAVHSLTIHYFWHEALTHHTVFPILSDILYTNFPEPMMFSFGDIFIWIGTFLVIQRFLNKPIPIAKWIGLDSQG